MEKELISAFYDNETGPEEFSWLKERLGRKETADLLKVYDEIGKHLRSGNVDVKLAKSFQARLRTSLQSEYDRSCRQCESYTDEVDRKQVSKDKAEAA